MDQKRLFIQGILLGCFVLTRALPTAAADTPAFYPTLWNPQPAAAAAVFSFGQVFPLSSAGGTSTAHDPSWSARWSGAEAIRPWTELALELIVKYQQNPLRAARVLTLTHTAIHDALSLAVHNKLGPAERVTAMHRAAGLVLNHLYPQEPPGRLEGLGAAAASAAVAGSDLHANRIESALRSGEQAAALAISRSTRDGAGKQWPVRMRPKDQPGRWRATPPLNIYNPSDVIAATWRTWVLRDGGEIPAPPPPAFDSPEYQKEVEEVLQVARALTREQKEICDRWNLGLGTVTPPGVWNKIALDLVRANGVDTENSARIFAALNVAMMDAFIASWHVKYVWWTERPVTAIRERFDPDFLPHVVTPAFPAYVSGHSTVSGAAEIVLATYFPDRAGWLREQSEEAALSRLLAGIHFRSDNEEGLKLGRRVGERVVAHLKSRTHQAADTHR